MGIILLTVRGLREDQIARVREIAPQMEVLVTRDREVMEQALDEIEVVAGSMPVELIRRAPRLRWIQQWGAGADWLVYHHPDAAGRDFVLTSTVGMHAVPISEQIMGYLLVFARRLHGAMRDQAARRWSHLEPQDVFELEGKTMLLVGVGAIGRRTARVAAAFGMRVLGIRRHPEQTVPYVEAMYAPDRLLELLPQADVVVLTVPLTRETVGMFGEAEFRAMKPSAYFINIGRGKVVREEALIRALREGWIAGAGLDVFETEPLPPSSPLWAMENVIITAHYAGLTPVYHERAMAIFLDNLRRYVAGEPLHHVVDKGAGY